MDIKRNLYHEMAKDSIVISYLSDKGIATDFYRALCNVDWYVIVPPVPEDEQIIRKLRGDKMAPWTCSWRTAGGYIAEIRNIHHNASEDYMDYYCAGEEGTVSPLVRECFERMGWTPVTY